MDMEGIGSEEYVGSCNNNDATHIAKGKRTKRLRPLSPSTMITSSCSSASGEHGSDYGSFSSTTTTFEGTDQEEQDMANCLILLAQGKGGGDAHHHHHHLHHEQQVEDHKMTERGSSSSSSRRFAEMATATTTKIGFYVYECKTCNRTFPSFQALGGHRASHKKPKATPPEEKKSPPSPPPPAPMAAPQPSPPLITNCEIEEVKQALIKSSPPISLQLGYGNRATFQGNKSKIHECSVCGSEFTSGQALGGHMRRHRASGNPTSTQVVDKMNGIETSCDVATSVTAVEVKPRNVLELDLNLPAPEDDLRDSKFQFTAAQKSMVLSAAPALVGCHY